MVTVEGQHALRPPLSARGRSGHASPISELMRAALTDPDLISLAAGFVDYDTLPAREVAAATQRVLDDPAKARAALQYGATEGLPALRRAIFSHLAALDGMTPQAFAQATDGASADDVVVTNGSQQSLHILADLLIDPGDVVVTAWPSYFVFTGALSALGASVRSVDMDEDGMMPGSLDALLGRMEAQGQLQRVKMLYLQAYHQNPTGRTLAPGRRRAILDIIRGWSRRSGQRILVVEDAAYRELTFAGTSRGRTGAKALGLGGGSLKSLDQTNEYVAMLGTFSKPFAPGLKLGYALLPRDLVECVRVNKGARDFGSPSLCQHIALEALQSGAYAEHVNVLRRAYADKCGAMLTALQEHLGGLEVNGSKARWTRPAGGLYVWLELPDGVDTRRGGALFEAALKAGVLYVPGDYCYPRDATRTPPRHTIRLSFGVPRVDQITQGIARLARAVRASAD